MKNFTLRECIKMIQENGGFVPSIYSEIIKPDLVVPLYAVTMRTRKKMSDLSDFDLDNSRVIIADSNEIIYYLTKIPIRKYIAACISFYSNRNKIIFHALIGGRKPKTVTYERYVNGFKDEELIILNKLHISANTMIDVEKIYIDSNGIYIHI